MKNKSSPKSIIRGHGNTEVNSPKEQPIVESSEGEPGTYHDIYYSCCLNEVPLFQMNPLSPK